MRRFSCLLLLAVVGCGSGASAPPPLYPVTGTVIVKGKPLEDTMVQLIPSDQASKAKPGIGTTDAEGKFIIRTNGDKGANVGKFKVILGSGAPKMGTGKGYSLEEASKMSGKYTATGGIPVQETPFPKEWGDAATTPKEVEVTNGPVTINIEI